MLDSANPHAEKGCMLSMTGLCKDCPHWRCMPVDVTDPTTGKLLRQGTVWDCAFAWMMLGSWDAGRQAQGVHAAINRSETETTKRQDRLLHLVATGTVERREVEEWGRRLSQSSDPGTHSAQPSTPPESLPSSQEPT